MKSLRSRGALLLCLILLAVRAGAQTSTSTPTLTALEGFEQSLTLGNILPSAAVNLPANVQASITSGALDLRAQTNYNPAAGTLTVTFFTVQTGSPTPTNLSQTSPSSIYGSVTINVSQVFLTGQAVMFVGTVSSGSGTLLGSFQGAPASFSFAYSSATPPVLTNSILVIAGTAVAFSPTATGTVTITQPSTGSGGSGTGVTIVVSAGAGSASIGTDSFQVASNQVVLNASQSTSSNPGALMYSWVAAPGSQNAGIIGANTATPLIQLFNKGAYQFTLTVTDAKGVTATVTVSVQYV